MTQPVEAVAAHRLTLSAAELSVIFKEAGVTIPVGFGEPDVDEGDLRTAGATLRARGVVMERDDGRLRLAASVAANAATLAAATATVRVEVNIHGSGLRSQYGVSGPFGASLITLPRGGAELSFFPAEALGRELIRAMPSDDTSVQSALAQALDSVDSAPPAPLSGLLPLAALADYGTARAVDPQNGAARLVTALDLTPAETHLARQVSERTDGVLTCLVFGGLAGGSMAMGQVIWLATDHGRWTGLRPEPDGTARRMVRLVPVAPEDLGVWIAPQLAQILEAGA